MANPEKTILTTTFAADKPTPLHFADIYTWVIWQFPRFNGKWLCGAVRPPIADHNWLPAFIKPETEELLVHAHVTKKFKTPEAAADYCQRLKQTDINPEA